MASSAGRSAGVDVVGEGGPATQKRLRASSVATLAGMTLIAEILLVILVVVVPVAIVGTLFVWGARMDGEEDRAVQRRLGIRRKTRLGR